MALVWKQRLLTIGTFGPMLSCLMAIDWIRCSGGLFSKYSRIIGVITHFWPQNSHKFTFEDGDVSYWSARAMVSSSNTSLGRLICPLQLSVIVKLRCLNNDVDSRWSNSCEFWNYVSPTFRWTGPGFTLLSSAENGTLSSAYIVLRPGRREIGLLIYQVLTLLRRSSRMLSAVFDHVMARFQGKFVLRKTISHRAVEVRSVLDMLSLSWRAISKLCQQSASEIRDEIHLWCGIHLVWTRPWYGDGRSWSVGERKIECWCQENEVEEGEKMEDDWSSVITKQTSNNHLRQTLVGRFLPRT